MAALAKLLTPRRVAIVELLRERPGLGTKGVARAVGVDDATADYHLRRLWKAGVISRHKVGRGLAHFLRDAKR